MSADNQQQQITIDYERLAALATYAAPGPEEGSACAAEDARHLLKPAIERDALIVPGGLAVMVETEEEAESCWIRLILSTAGPGGLEYSKGWERLDGALQGGLREALEYAAAELNEILKTVDPRRPSIREAIVQAMRASAKGGEVSPADLCMELAARYDIGEAEAGFAAAANSQS